MKRKNMKRTAWYRLLQRTYTVRDCTFPGLNGRESVLKIHSVTQPLWVQEGYGRICIADAGHAWVQAAFEGLPVWLTAMFDRDGRFLQIYFDIARPPCFDDPDDPWFEDLYLDIVLTSQKDLVILDREELDRALEQGDLSPTDHAYALAACDQVYAWLEHDRDRVVDYVSRVYREMK